MRSQFPFDLIELVAKGEFGGDSLQHVRDNTGKFCGRILWESKRTRTGSDVWLTKLKKDQRNAHAELAVIVSQTMLKKIILFEQLEPYRPDTALRNHIRHAAVVAKITKTIGWHMFRHSVESHLGQSGEKART